MQETDVQRSRRLAVDEEFRDGGLAHGCRKKSKRFCPFVHKPLGRLRLLSTNQGRIMMRSEEFRADKSRPFTGAEYLASLRDGREVYINGERVADVTSHPAMRNSV